jgi:Lysylphosphatidylglycerol synthase TM region
VTRIILLAVGLAVLGAVLYFMGIGAIVALVRRSGWSIVWMVVLYALHLAIRGTVIWRALPEPRLPLLETVRIRFAAEAVEMLTFTGPFLAEPAKGFMFIRRGVAPARAAGVIVFENLTYMVIAAAMGLLGLLVLLSRGAFAGGVHGPIIALVCGLAGFVFGVIWAAVTGIGLLAPLVRLVSPVLGARRGAEAVENVASMEAHLLEILHGSPARFVESLFAQSGGHALLAIEVWLLFRALGFPAPWTDALIVEGGVKFINSVFVFIPGQFGAAEGTNAVIVGALGYPAAVGVTLSLLRRLRAYLVAGAGLLFAPPH